MDNRKKNYLRVFKLKVNIKYLNIQTHWYQGNLNYYNLYNLKNASHRPSVIFTVFNTGNNDFLNRSTCYSGQERLMFTSNSLGKIIWREKLMLKCFMKNGILLSWIKLFSDSQVKYYKSTGLRWLQM